MCAPSFSRTERPLSVSASTDSPNQHQVESFAVVVPSTNFLATEADSHSGGLHGPAVSSILEVVRSQHPADSSQLYFLCQIEVGSSIDLSYFAKVKLANGTAIDVPAGKATFLPLPQSEVGLSLARDGETAPPTSVFDLKFEKCKQVDQLDHDQEWKMELEMPSMGQLVQGTSDSGCFLVLIFLLAEV